MTFESTVRYGREKYQLEFRGIPPQIGMVPRVSEMLHRGILHHGAPVEFKYRDCRFIAMRFHEAIQISTI